MQRSRKSRGVSLPSRKRGLAAVKEIDCGLRQRCIGCLT
jgi:hypothetical protein